MNKFKVGDFVVGGLGSSDKIQLFLIEEISENYPNAVRCFGYSTWDDSSVFKPATYLPPIRPGDLVRRIQVKYKTRPTAFFIGEMNYVKCYIKTGTGEELLYFKRNNEFLPISDLELVEGNTAKMKKTILPTKTTPPQPQLNKQEYFIKIQEELGGAVRGAAWHGSCRECSVHGPNYCPHLIKSASHQRSLMGIISELLEKLPGNK